MAEKGAFGGKKQNRHNARTKLECSSVLALPCCQSSLNHQFYGSKTLSNVFFSFQQRGKQAECFNQEDAEVLSIMHFFGGRSVVTSHSTTDVRGTSGKQPNIQCQVWRATVRSCLDVLLRTYSGPPTTNTDSTDIHFCMSEGHLPVDVQSYHEALNLPRSIK